MAASKDVDINTIPLDAPLSIPEPPMTWIISQNRKGIDSKRLTLPDVDLSGKWVLVSGSNNGIGRHAAIQFAAWGANVILAARDPPEREMHPSKVVEECKEAARKKGHEESTIEWWEVDYSKLKSVEGLTTRWLDTGRPLDILCNNAGIGTSPGGSAVFKTEDGFEIIHQVNFLAHVLLTLRLLPSLAKAPAPRVVCTTSCFHFLGAFNLANCNGELGETGVKVVGFYQNNKLWFQVWLTELQRRLLQHDEYKHITVNGVHPGYVNSGIWNLNYEAGWLTQARSGVFKLMAYFLGIDEQQGSLAILNAATGLEAGPDPEVQGVGEKGGLGGGRYFSRITEETPMPHTKDPDCRQRVWRKVNEELKLEEEGLLDVLGLKYEESP
jgi:NAD(P)-dependent dehydrogenase (short-subunit alcohol dehydrogenase family)